MRRIVRSISVPLCRAALVFFLAGLAIIESLAAGPEIRRVFVLNSFNRGYTWTDNMLRGIDDAFDSSGLNVETYVSFMDMKRIPPTREYFLQFKELIREGYKGVRFEAVLACDNDALEFIRKYRDELFPGTPVVFSSINDFEEQMLDGRKDLTGTSENTDYAGTLNIALQLRPAAKKVVVIVDNTTTGKAHRSAVEKIQHDFSQRIEINYISLADVTMEELAVTLSTLDKESIVLLLQHFVDRTGAAYTVQQSTRLLAKNSSVPIFVVSDIRVGLGVLGGRVASGYHHGKAAALMVIKILNGADAGTIPVLLNGPNKFMFDYAVMQRFNISESNLPAESIVMNKPVSVLEKYRNELIFILVVFVGLCSILFSLMLEIRSRKRSEKALAHEKERLAITLRSIGDGVITTDMRGTIVMLNKAAEEMTGWKSEEAAGRSLPEVFVIINEITREPCENPVEKVMSTGGIVELANHTCLVSRLGREMMIADSGAPIRDSMSRITGVVLVFRDMTEKQKLNDSMQRAQKLESLGILAGGIAHDFNNMLAGIFGYLEMAKDNAAANKTDHVLKYLSKALNIFDRAKALTQQLLTFSRGGAPIRKTTQLLPLIQHSTVFSLSGSNVTSHFDLADNLWMCDCDENQIGQAIDNIVINAKQAMPMGGKIFVSAVNTENPPGHCGRYVRISITDQGTGMPAEILVRIFDPFFSTKETGHGLGLATVFSIIQRHDGWIDVESKQGNGSTFDLYIPASQKIETADQGTVPAVHRGSGKILVMDDEEFMLEIAGNMLREMGYTVASAKNGEEALTLFSHAEKSGDPFAVSILDLTIPGGMGGKDAASAMKKINSSSIIIASSGYSEDQVISNSTEFGFTDRIIKPYRKKELSELMRKLGK